ncbi:MAG: hypothetical protein IJT18_06560 [Oscillospiraceae bacterium]|nr:hypothetical protein [Oscillospiraceae bacterium]
MKKLLILSAVLVCLLLCCFFAGAADIPLTGTETEVTGMDFTTAKEIRSQSYTLTSAEQAAISNGDLVVFTFVTKAKTACTKMTVTVDGAEGVPSLTYFIPVQWTRVTVPVVAKNLSSVALTVEGTVLMAQASYENRGAVDIATTDTESGQHLLEPFVYTRLDGNAGLGVGSTKDILRSGNFLYSIGSADSGSLKIIDVSDPASPQVRGKLTDLGGSIRQISLCKTGTDVIITSRQNGAYIADVSDPDHPRVRSVYNSIEMATGLSVAGDLAFICNRQNGIEIVDISDLDHPKHICNVRSGEVQGCLASGNILYCGLWDLCRVDMFDISDLSNVQLIGSAPLSGKGDGMTVCTVGDRTYLYAATGQHTEKVASSTTQIDLRYGHGNGLDIFDVTDPAHPEWLSTSRVDGRYYYPNSDNWEAHVSVHDGHVYAYLVCTLNGVYTFDVTDPRAPIRLEHIDVVCPKGTPNYKVLSYSGRVCIFPYDQNVETHGAISAIDVVDGVMYLGDFNTDSYIYQGGEAVYDRHVPPAANVDPAGGESYYTSFDGAGLQGYAAVRNGYQYYTVEPHGDNLFVACGSAGLLVMDKEMNTLAQYPTDGICFDLYIHGDTLYAAVGDAGVAAYTISGTTLTKQWVYKAQYGTCRSVEASKTGKFLALQTGANYVELIDTANHNKTLIWKKGSAQAYHRNLLRYQGGRYLGAWSLSSYEYWFDCGENDSLTTPKLVKTFTTSKNSMAGGGTQAGNLMLAMPANGYMLYDPLSEATTITGTTIKADSTMTGNPIIEGNVMISCDRIYGHIYMVDVSNISAPKVLKTVDVPGNPDLARVVDDTVYVPLGYQGMMKFDFLPFRLESGYVPENDADAIAAGYSWSYTTESGETTYYRDLTGDYGAYTQGLAKDDAATREHAGVLKLLQDYTITAEMPENTNALISNPAKAFNLDFNGHKITNSLATRTGAYFLYYNASSGSYTAKVHFFSSADTPGEYDHSAYTDSATRMMIGAGFGNISANIKMDVTVENLIASSGNMPIINMESTDNRLVLRGCDFTTAKKQYAAVVVGVPNGVGVGGSIPCRADVTVEDCTLRSGFCGLELVDYVYINSANKTNYYTTDFHYTLTLLGTNTFTCQPTSRAAATHGVLIEMQTGTESFEQSDPADVAATSEGNKLVWAEPVTEDTLTSFTVTSEQARVPGDLDGNGTVNMRDILTLRQALAGGYGVVIPESVGDLNHDGSTNMRDLLTLRQYLAGGYGVTLG